MTNPFDLTGRVAVVTGGYGVLGGSMADAFAGAGAKVAVLGRNPEAAEQKATSLREGGAEAQALAGDLTHAQATIDQALLTTEQTGERWTEAELLRIKGDILALGKKDDPRACWQQALEIARSQQARLWELRTAMSLARWLKNQGEQQAALNVLQPVYAWFSEGFECPAIKSAAELLADLQV